MDRTLTPGRARQSRCDSLAEPEDIGTRDPYPDEMAPTIVEFVELKASAGRRRSGVDRVPAVRRGDGAVLGDTDRVVLVRLRAEPPRLRQRQRRSGDDATVGNRIIGGVRVLAGFGQD